MVFYVTCNDISIIYVTAQICRRTEEEVVIIGNEMKNEAEVVPTYRKKL